MKKILIIVLGLFLSIATMSQDRNWMLNGYIQSLQNLWVPPPPSNWMTQTNIKNRLDFRWFPGNVVSFHVGGNNQFNFGQMVELYYPYQVEATEMDNGFMDLSKVWVDDSSYYFYTQIDRANIKISTGKFEATVGRQRINWGINMVWNPNDIFNAYDYFDFNYVERPGSDAVLLEYYTGMVSSIQFGFKIDHENQITSALMYKFNRWNYDFQAFAGIMETDYTAGIGWSGDIKTIGFTGEASYFIDRDNFADTNGVLTASISANYSFKMGLTLNASYLFSSHGTTGNAGWGSALGKVIDVNAKTFTLAKNSIFGGISYPISPIIQGDLSAIWNPNDKSGYFGPSINFSLTDNISLLLLGQIFWGQHMTEFGDYGSFYYAQLQWSF